MNRSLLIESIEPDELAAVIAAEVAKQLGPVIRRASEPDTPRVASREQMARMLGWSIAKLDRRTAEGLPSFMDEGRRGYIVEDVFAWLKERTPEAEAKARERQAAKRAAKKKNPGETPIAVRNAPISDCAHRLAGAMSRCHHAPGPRNQC